MKHLKYFFLFGIILFLFTPLTTRAEASLDLSVLPKGEVMPGETVHYTVTVSQLDTDINTYIQLQFSDNMEFIQDTLYYYFSSDSNTEQHTFKSTQLVPGSDGFVIALAPGFEDLFFQFDVKVMEDATTPISCTAKFKNTNLATTLRQSIHTPTRAFLSVESSATDVITDILSDVDEDAGFSSSAADFEMNSRTIRTFLFVGFVVILIVMASYILISNARFKKNESKED